MDTNSHIRAPLQLARFLDGTNPRVPRTVAQMYKEVVDQPTEFDQLVPKCGEPSSPKDLMQVPE